MNNILGDKPIQFEVSVSTKSAIILGAAMFVAIAAAYFLIRSLKTQ